MEDWWLSTLSEEERQHIKKKFQPLGSTVTLTSGDISYTSETAFGMLTNLAGGFEKDEDRHIAYRILEKAEELLKNEANVLHVHFFYNEKIILYYKDSDKPQYLEKAIEACRQQIALAPKAAAAFKVEYKEFPLPAHRGYEQLASILESQKKYNEAIELCEQAEKQG
ncbi:MAG: hypothetical protein NTV14_10590, partial [Coprothermobacterota bacterium]|nr:hypothetical protein [Coprothermobacterota bacterium]